MIEQLLRKISSKYLLKGKNQALVFRKPPLNIPFNILTPFMTRITEFKVARSDFWVTIPFNFERLEHHHYQSNRKSNDTSVLEKDESFK